MAIPHLHRCPWLRAPVLNIQALARQPATYRPIELEDPPLGRVARPAPGFGTHAVADLDGIDDGAVAHRDNGRSQCSKAPDVWSVGTAIGRQVVQDVSEARQGFVAVLVSLLAFDLVPIEWLVELYPAERRVDCLWGFPIALGVCGTIRTGVVGILVVSGVYGDTL